LGCAVREKRNIVWVCPDIVEQSLEGLDDAVRDAVDMWMYHRRRCPPEYGRRVSSQLPGIAGKSNTWRSG
jgi:hypothetical protein